MKFFLFFIDAPNLQADLITFRQSFLLSKSEIFGNLSLILLSFQDYSFYEQKRKPRRIASSRLVSFSGQRIKQIASNWSRMIALRQVKSFPLYRQT